MTHVDAAPSSNWSSRPWWPFAVLVGLVLIAATASASRYISPINLAGENNLAVWWSGGLYFLAALHAYAVAMRSVRGDKVAWLLFAAGMMLMLCTEIGSVHERVPRHSVAAVVAALLLVSFLLLLKTPRYRGSAILLAAGVMMNASALVQEKIEFSFEWTGWMVGVRAAAEEGSELVASFLMLAGALRANCDGWRTPIRDVFGRLEVSQSLIRPLLSTVVVGVGVSVLTATLTDLINRGNPSSLYPLIVYLLAACMTLRTAQIGFVQQAGFAHLTLALILLYCSADAMCLFVWNALVYYPDPGADHTVAVWGSYQPIAYLSHAGLLSLWLMARGRLLTKANVLLLAVIVGVAVFAVVSESLHAQLLLAPITAASMLLILHRADVWARQD